MAEEKTYDIGEALIVEGSTEKVFYSEFIENRALANGVSIAKVADGDGTNYVATRHDGTSVLVKLNNVGTITQMTNSAEWFHRSCASRYADIPWTVFLGYDTDAYNSNITKFHEGDWARLRNDIEPKAVAIIDLAAKADIEDIMLCNYTGVLSFLGLPSNTEMPYGRKGKARMKKLHKMVALNKPYHEGDKARPLVRALDMDEILRTAPIPLGMLEATIVGSSENRM
ncbi:MAG: hypothetical protein IJ125_01915 [Atopobiaceae bacterium]|nr:hypothetical protein [Atopobiaceae bacterium]